MAFIFCTISLWICFLLIISYKLWSRYYPTIIFADLIGVISDLFGVVFNQWAYYGPTVGGLSLWSVLGIAPAEGGLFIRLFPKGKSPLTKVGYWAGWAIVNTIGELLFVKAGWIGYLKWNSFRALVYYLFFFGAVWLQEYWYNGTGRVK